MHLLQDKAAGLASLTKTQLLQWRRRKQQQKKKQQQESCWRGWQTRHQEQAQRQ
jgi:hypothetical protein